jgi:organic radical activating enzyme
VLILSGGEPLLHPDIFDISQRAKDMGFYVALSSNGTLITEQNIQQIAEINYQYVGVSLGGESLFLRKLVLGIPAQASGKNLTRPPMPSIDASNEPCC